MAGFLAGERATRLGETYDRADRRHFAAESDRAALHRDGWRPPAPVLGPQPIYPYTAQRIPPRCAPAECTIPHTARRCWYCGHAPEPR